MKRRDSPPAAGAGGRRTLWARCREIGFAEWLLTASLLAAGGFHEYLACILSAAMLAWLAVRALRAGRAAGPRRGASDGVPLYGNLTAAAVLAIALFYALSAFWAVDSGTAVIGFLKFLPAPLYLLVLQQSPGAAEGIRTRLPYTAAALALLAAAGMSIPALSGFFSVAGRLAGTFQYPNTFALFLLAAELLLASRVRRRAWDWAVLAVLAGGILYTGSRAVFVLAVVSNTALLLRVKNRRVRWGVLAGLALAAAGAGVYAAAGGGGLLRRLVSLSLSESTFVGRLLYARDALPLILRRPFGLGYLGYAWVQGGVQTGVYTVQYVHNDFLQLLLDVGWIPAILAAAAVLKALFGGKKPFAVRLILAVLAAHACFDFDLQFTAMIFVWLLFLDTDTGRRIPLRRGAPKRAAACLLSAAVCLYGGTALALSRFGGWEAAHALYPWNTANELYRLAAAPDAAQAAGIADGILRRNPSVSAAYSAKARYAYTQGDFSEVIRQGRQAIAAAPLAYAPYEAYAGMLANGIRLYERAGRAADARLCRQELAAVAAAVHTADRRLSWLGGRIRDRPPTRLPAEIEALLEPSETLPVS